MDYLDTNKSATANKVHIAGRGSVVRQLRIPVSQFRVLWTGTLFEIRPDNMYQPLCFMPRAVQTLKLDFKFRIKTSTFERIKA